MLADYASTIRSSTSVSRTSRADEELEAVLAETKDYEMLKEAYKQLDMSIYPLSRATFTSRSTLHCTSTARGPGPKIAAQRAEKGKGAFWHPLLPKRCNVEEEIGLLRGDPHSLVYCVGPDPLINTAKEACTNLGVKFKGETSEF